MRQRGAGKHPIGGPGLPLGALAALGLAAVAIKAGARSALATRRSIHDSSSALPVTEFHCQLGAQPAATEAEALCRAQRALAADPRHRHPAFRSSLLIIGTWL